MSLNPQQIEAVQHTEGPLLVLAGAGTGKTRVITERTNELLRRGVPAKHILCVTFTNKAAREMVGRIERRVGKRRADGLTVCTFHSFGARLLRRHIDRLGYRRSFTIMGTGDQLALIRTALRDLGRGDDVRMVKPEAVLARISLAKNEGATPSPHDLAGELAAEVFARYGNLLRVCHAVDFDDLLVLPNRLLAEHPDVLAQVQQQYRYVQVDEFQDTNTQQLELVHAITREHQNLAVVGDDDQAIYGWRGAKVDNILTFDRLFGAANTTVVRLEQNYRSTETILSAANAVIAGNPNRHEKQLFSELGQGPPVRLIVAEDEITEVREVVGAIATHKASGGAFGECAVLFRTNTMMRPFEELMREQGVPYILIGGQKYFERKEVRDALAYVRLLVNPADNVCFLRAVNYPSRGVGQATLEKLQAFAEARQMPFGVAIDEAGADVSAITGLAPGGRLGLSRFRELLGDARRKLSVIGTSGLADLCRELFARVGFEDELTREYANAAEAHRRHQSVLAVADSLQGFVERETAQPGRKPGALLAEYLDRVALVDDQDSADKADRLKRDAAVLITIHSCKGLEFPHVTIAGFEEGVLPHKKTEADSDAGANEERRLAYVAMTRARETLTLTMARTRKRYGKTVSTQPSRFLTEIPGHLFDTKAQAKVRQETAAKGLAALRATLDSAGGPAAGTTSAPADGS